MEELNTVNEVQESVVDSQTPEVEASVEEQQTEETSPVVEPEPVAKAPQTPEENHQFAELRRKYESQINELKASNESLTRLQGTIRDRFGYEGSADEMNDAIIARDRGISVEEVRAEREQENARFKAAMEASPEMQRLKQAEAELNRYRFEEAVAKEIKIINAAFPDAKVTDYETLGGESYGALRAQGIPPETAFQAVALSNKAQAAQKPPVPTQMGAVNTGTVVDPEYMTDEEIDSYSVEDFVKNPKLLEKANKTIWHRGKR